MKYIILYACFAMFIGVSCKKNKPKTELEKLPPITQTGAKTFGCLINGKTYIPGGGGILDRIMIVQYDPTFEQGQFSIKTQKIINSNEYISLSIHADSIKSPGVYQLSLKSKYWIYYDNLKNNQCFFETINQQPISGVLTLTKFDTINKIVSGTFSFKISTPECGLIEATDGRFDVKY